MAYTRDVSTLAELITAMNGVNSNPVTINLTQDINAGAESPTGVANLPICFYLGSSYTINGNGHKIINLRTTISNPQPIFNFNEAFPGDTSRHIYFKNIDFVNLILGGNTLLKNTRSGYKFSSVNFSNCRFVGQRTGEAYIVNQNINVNLESCYFDMPWLAANDTTYTCTSLIPKLTEATENRATAYYCRFKETYGGWVVPRGGSDNPKYMLSCSYMDLHGCRIEGSMKADYSRTNGPSTYVDLYVLSPYNDYEASTPNVVDMYWDIVYANTPANFFMPKIAGVFNKNTSKVSSYGWGVYADGVSTRPSPIGATPDEMKNATWLSNQGFPIIIPSSS